jgi:hypothetical protein
MFIKADVPRGHQEQTQPTSSAHGGHLGVRKEPLDQLSSETGLMTEYKDINRSVWAVMHSAKNEEFAQSSRLLSGHVESK